MTPGEGERRPLKVVLVSQPTSAGVAVCVRDLATAAVNAGHHVVVVCPGVEHGPLARWVEEAGAEHIELAMVRRPALRDLRDAWSIRKVSGGADVVHLHSSKAGAVGRAGLIWRRRRRPAIVFTPHAWSWSVGGRLAPVYRFIERSLAGRADAIVAVSDAEAAEGRTVLGGSADRITAIVNGVDRERFSPDGPQAARDPDRPLIVCVGRLCEQKGQDIAIRALSRIGDGSARLRLVGDGPDRAQLQGLAESVGVAGRIEWVGEVADTAPHFRAADVVIAPSRWEGMSLVFLEAMASGAAIIVTDVAGSENVGDAGIVIPRDDERALADALDALLGNRATRDGLGAAARERSSAHDLAATLELNLSLWERVVGSPAGRRRGVEPRDHDNQ